MLSVLCQTWAEQGLQAAGDSKGGSNLCHQADVEHAQAGHQAEEATHDGLSKTLIKGEQELITVVPGPLGYARPGVGVLGR